MKQGYTFAGVVLLSVLVAGPVSARRGYQGPGVSSCMPVEGVALERIALTEEQRAAVERVKKAYDDKINELKGKLMTRRLELQSIFRNPHAGAETVRAKAFEVFEIQNECRSVEMDYQIEIRGILTPEQLRNWCTPGDWCIPGNRRK